MRELVRLPFLFLYRILMPAGEFEMLDLERGHSDLTASDSFLFERKKRKEERSCGDRTRGYAVSSWLPVVVKQSKMGSRRLWYYSRSC